MQRKLGNQGLIASQQGIGCMGMTAFYGSFDRAIQEEESLKTIGKAIELGINLFDTAWIYQSFGQGGGGNFTNEELLGKAIKMYGRDKFVICTKFGIERNPDGTGTRISGSESTIRTQVEESLNRLGITYIDLYYQHRMDKSIPIEQTVSVLKSLIEEGKIKYIGLSECTADELRRAHSVHPITAIQMEWSLQTRGIEKEIVPTARELGVAIVAYSPLGRGLLSGTFKSKEDIGNVDSRLSLPRFQDGNFEANIPNSFFAIAERKKCTPAQLALAWLHSQGEDVFPIPGTKSSVRVEENVTALQFVPLSPEELLEIEASVPEAIGHRYSQERSAGTYDAPSL